MFKNTGKELNIKKNVRNQDFATITKNFLKLSCNFANK